MASSKRSIVVGRIVLILLSMMTLGLAIELFSWNFVGPFLGRPSWLLPSAIAGCLFTLAARLPIGRPIRLGFAASLGALPAALILASMLAFEGIHFVPTALHFSPLLRWTLYAESMMALSVLVGVAVGMAPSDASRD